jgi:hypothetical protein
VPRCLIGWQIHMESEKCLNMQLACFVLFHRVLGSEYDKSPKL